MNDWEIETQKALAARSEVQKVQEASTPERVKWIEDEVEELERWDGME